MKLDIENHEALHSFLVRSGRIEKNEPVEFRNLSGGVSNRAVWVSLPSRQRDWVIKQALEQLRVPVEWHADPARIQREALGLRHLAALAPDSITPLVFEHKVFFLLAMEAVPLPHENWKELMMQGAVELDHARSFGRLLGTIHKESWRERADLEPVFDDRQYFESLRLEPYYDYSAKQVPEAAEFLGALIEETRNTRCALVHGDFSPKNILIRNKQMILLDHEVVHWGDPAFDVGFGLAHLFSKAHHFPQSREDFMEAALLAWKEYRAAVRTLAWSNGLEPRAVRHTLACLLARVSGRSQLEYLSDQEKDRQRRAVLRLMAEPPQGMESLATQFVALLGR